jgi:biopolymer transport protein ExbD
MGKFSSSSDDSGGEPGIDMSPMLDCVFILLIFFIITTTFVEERGIEVEKPQPAAASNQQKPNCVFVVDAKGTILHDGAAIGIDRVPSIVKRAIATEDVPVVIQAERLAPSGLMVKVMDQARSAGATKVSIANRGS